MFTVHEMMGRRVLSLLARSVFTPIVDFIYPPFCLICERRLEGEQHVCTDCWQSMAKASPAIAASDAIGLEGPVYFQHSFALFEYSDAVRKLVHNMKYKGVSSLAVRFGGELARAYAAQKASEKIDLLVPVPLHPARLRERGYNQAGLLAGGMTKVMQVRVIHALRRIRYTKQQAKFDRDQRITNVKDAFRIVDPSEIKGKNVALIDDVLTTGSTLNECAKELQQAGAGYIIAFTIVRI